MAGNSHVDTITDDPRSPGRLWARSERAAIPGGAHNVAVFTETLIGAVVSRMISRVAELASGGDPLSGDLGRTVGSAGGAKASEAVSKYFASRRRRAALEGALSDTLAAVEAAHPEFVRYGGGFEWGFLELEASAELAKALVVDSAPDPMAISGELRQAPRGESRRVDTSLVTALGGGRSPTTWLTGDCSSRS